MARTVNSFREMSYSLRSRTLRSSTTTNFEQTSMPMSILARKIGTPGQRALIDTSVLADLKKPELRRLPPWLAASTLTFAELVRGPEVATHAFEKARRRQHLQQVEASIEALPFDFACAQAYGRISVAVERIGRKPRGSRVVDLLIAATALAHDLPLYTLNSKDLRGLENLVEIVDVGA